ncbi:MAG: phosphate ABC transporter permease, partial [Methylomonas sp.]|nr:phosphate ABC transporter permease [Methylomonas sp.]
MSETQSSPRKATLLQLSSTDAYQRWRLLKDKIVAQAVVFGGLSIIFAVVLIFFYLLYVVFPLLLPSHAEAVSHYDAPEP